MGKFDFSGWATRNDLLCGDGRTIRKNAFKDNDGQTVPLVWNHQHNESFDVLSTFIDFVSIFYLTKFNLINN